MIICCIVDVAVLLVTLPSVILAGLPAVYTLTPQLGL